MLLRRLDTGEEFESYSAINVIGCVDAVQMGTSQHRLRFGKPYFTGPITIDPGKSQNLLAFRLVKGPGFIVMSD